MRVLFFARDRHLRRFVEVVLALVEGRDEVVVAYEAALHGKLPHGLRGVEGVRLERYEGVADARRGEAVSVLRQLRDYAWYLRPEQEQGSYNRRRALDLLVRAATGDVHKGDPAWADPPVAVPEGAAGGVEDAVGALERALPPDPGVVEFLRAQQPDVVLVSPLVLQGSHQAEVVKAARALGIPSGFLVHSWDNLTNKGRIHVAPDRVFVWNEIQRREAVDLHGIDPASVVVTGAPHWDPFFLRSPSSSWEEFCAERGFDPGEPLVLYLGSTKNVSRDEHLVVERWLDAVRSAPGALGRANVLVRRHPSEPGKWAGWVPRHERVAVSADPAIAGQDLYDELHHASVAVGLNTSAQLEASIVGTPVYSFAAGDLAPGQGTTLHFYYLLRDHGGVVSYAETLEEHVRQVEQGLRGDFDREAIRRFCEFFVRPRGLDRPVTPIVVEEIRRLGSRA